MRSHHLLVAAVLGVAASAAAAPPRTMRLDYFHTGGAAREIFALDRVVIEPLPWPGNPARPLDELNLGKYFFAVVDLATNRVVYSRGFDSIYGEWETTAEAKQRDGTYHESLRFPAPERPVQVVVRKRDARNVFRDVWATVVDPAGKYVDTAAAPTPASVITVASAACSNTEADRRSLSSTCFFSVMSVMVMTTPPSALRLLS